MNVCYDQFPFLVVHAAPSIYHIEILPRRRSLRYYREAARRQCAHNQLSTCAVLAADLAFYFHPAGREVESKQPPLGGMLVTGGLHPAFRTGTLESAARRQHLRDTVQNQFKTGRVKFTFGDLTKGGRPPREDELEALCGSSEEGVPNGLQACTECGELCGECLEVSPGGHPLVQLVVCRCANNSCCARCGELLYERKVNANYWCREQHAVIHVPGFTAFVHRCANESELHAKKRIARFRRGK